jgi:hypothetical protein
MARSVPTAQANEGANTVTEVRGEPVNVSRTRLEFCEGKLAARIEADSAKASTAKPSWMPFSYSEETIVFGSIPSL